MTANSNVRFPETRFSIEGAATTVTNTDHRVVGYAQMLPAGTATAKQRVSVDNNKATWATLFGAKSDAYAMVAAFRAINAETPLDIVPLADGVGATAASGTYVVAGTATEAGSYTLTVGSSDISFTIPVANGDTATIVGDAVEAAINAHTTVQVTAANVLGTVTLTASNAGLEGNDLTVTGTGVVAGLTLTVNAMSGGLLSPDFANIFDTIADLRYQTFVWPSSYTLATVADEVDSRFNTADGVVLDGVALTTVVDTSTNAIALSALFNSQSLSITAISPASTAEIKGSSVNARSLSVTASIAAIRALRLTDGVDITGLTIASGLDNIGGVALSSLPYANTPLSTLPPVAVGLGYTATEIKSMKNGGVSVVGNNTNNTALIVGEMLTTYKTDVAGNPDDSFVFLNSVDTMSAVREYMVSNVKKRFGQSRLTNGVLRANRSVANSQSIRSYIRGLYKDTTGTGMMLTEAGRPAESFFNDNLTIVIDLAAGQATVTMRVPVVTQLRSIIGSIAISFGTGA